MANVQIEQDVLDGLRDSREILNALHAGGVENWEWYSESLKGYWAKKEKEKERKEWLQGILDELGDILCDELMVEEPAGRGCGYAVRDEGFAAISAIITERCEMKAGDS